MVFRQLEVPELCSVSWHRKMDANSNEADKSEYDVNFGNSNYVLAFVDRSMIIAR